MWVNKSDSDDSNDICIFLKIPFIGDHSYNLSKKLKRIIETDNKCKVRINYIQPCDIVQLCILRKLEAFCMPDVGGHVISREFSRDAQLYNTHAVCNFTGTSMDNAALSSRHFFT